MVLFYFIFGYMTLFNSKLTTNFCKCKIMQLLQCILDKETYFRSLCVSLYVNFFKNGCIS